MSVRGHNDRAILHLCWIIFRGELDDLESLKKGLEDIPQQRWQSGMEDELNS